MYSNNIDGKNLHLTEKRLNCIFLVGLLSQKQTIWTYNAKAIYKNNPVSKSPGRQISVLFPVEQFIPSSS